MTTTPAAWPFFDTTHTALAARLSDWHNTQGGVPEATNSPALVAQARAFAQALADFGLLEYAIPPMPNKRIDLRAFCLIREALAYDSALADSVFAMQGIGTAGLWLQGSPALQATYLSPCRAGQKIAAFALSEPDGGSDAAAIAATAAADGANFVLNGTKAWISNAGIADHYIVIARTGEAPGARGLSAFIVDADTPGLRVGPPIPLMAPHVIADVTFEDCRVAATQRIGAPGAGFKLAMATLDIFRASVGAAATGLARRALAETRARVKTRRLFGRPMADMETVQTKLADMAADVDIAALVTYRAAWTKDTQDGRATREAATAKLVATEAAQRVIDTAVQLFGGVGLTQGSVVERLYREIRPMRIYEGASEIQKLVIARSLLAEDETRAAP